MLKSLLTSFPAWAAVSSAVLYYVLMQTKKKSASARSIAEKSGEKPSSTTVLANVTEERRYIDMKRWASISRPQYKYACGVASLTGVFNFLYSKLGHGDMEPISQEQVMKVLGFDEPFGEIRFGPFTGNQTLIKWFRLLTLHYNVKGKASIYWKEHGANKTPDMDGSKAEAEIITSLKDPNVAFIYHCYNHYMVPIGYEIDSNRQVEALDQTPPNHDDVTTWFLFGDSSRTSRAVQCIKYKDIAKDISLQSPACFNVRHPEQGELKKKHSKRIGGNLHCFIVFKKEFEPSSSSSIPASAKKNVEKKASSKKKRKNDDISKDVQTLSKEREFVVTRKETPVEILLTKKQRKLEEAAAEQQEANDNSSNDEKQEFTMEDDVQEEGVNDATQ